MRSETSIMMALYPLRLPPICPPENITLRHFMAGDEVIWENIVSEAFKEGYSFDSYLCSKGFFPEHTWFACINKKPGATASLWYRPQSDQPCGYIHMVGALSELSGNRLGYWVTLAALHQLKREKCPMALLHTDDYRLSAIWTYLNLGFRVIYDRPDTFKRWEAVIEKFNLDNRLKWLLSKPSDLPENISLKIRFGHKTTNRI